MRLAPLHSDRWSWSGCWTTSGAANRVGLWNARLGSVPVPLPRRSSAGFNLGDARQAPPRVVRAPRIAGCRIAATRTYAARWRIEAGRPPTVGRARCRPAARSHAAVVPGGSGRLSAPQHARSGSRAKRFDAPTPVRAIRGVQMSRAGAYRDVDVLGISWWSARERPRPSARIASPRAPSARERGWGPAGIGKAGEHERRPTSRGARRPQPAGTTAAHGAAGRDGATHR